MERKIIFFDVDGTIYTKTLGGISKRVREAIKETREKGHLCFIASGRPYGYITDNVKEIGFDGYVLANGANVKYDGKDLSCHILDYNLLKVMIDNLKKHSIEYILLTTDRCYINKDNVGLLNFYKQCNFDYDHFCYDYNEEDIFPHTIKVEVWVNNDSELAYAKKSFHGFAYEVHPDNQSIEVYAKDISKATGILDVLKLLDISVDNSYCFGDGPNDVEMFETVGHGIAMGNAVDIIKEKANDICLSVEEDGVAYKLKELF